MINKRKNTGLKHFIDSKTCLEYLIDIDDINKNIEEFKSSKQRKILFVFDDMIADTFSDKIVNPVLTELLIRGRKLNTCLLLFQNLVLLFQKY